MSEQKFELSPDALRRVVKAARRVETARRKSIGQGQIEQAGAGSIPSPLAACISTTATSGVYPGILVAQQTPASVNPPFSPPTSSNAPPPGRKVSGSSPVSLPSGMVPIGDGTQDCWLQFNSGVTPTSGNVYACQVSGQTQAFGGNQLPVLFTDDLSGGSTTIPHGGATLFSSSGFSCPVTAGNHDSGYHFTLPNAGTYLVFGICSAEVTSAASLNGNGYPGVYVSVLGDTATTLANVFVGSVGCSNGMPANSNFFSSVPIGGYYVTNGPSLMRINVNVVDGGSQLPNLSSIQLFGGDPPFLDTHVTWIQVG